MFELDVQVTLQDADGYTIELQAQVVAPLDEVANALEERLQRRSDHVLLVVAASRDGNLVQEYDIPSLLVHGSPFWPTSTDLLFARIAIQGFPQRTVDDEAWSQGHFRLPTPWVVFHQGLERERAKLRHIHRPTSLKILSEMICHRIPDEEHLPRGVQGSEPLRRARLGYIMRPWVMPRVL